MKINSSNVGSSRLLYKVNEVAEMLGVSGKTVYRLCDRGLLQYSKALRHKMIVAQSVEAFAKGGN